MFHVIASTAGAGDISDDLIRSQIDILNEDFRAKPGSLGAPGHDVRIEFYLAQTDPMGLPTTGIVRYSNDTWHNDNGNFMRELGWDTTRFLNIFTNGTGALGYASLPQESAGSSDDGVVLTFTTVGRDAPMGGVYDKGRTGTHEVGHYLGLLHTFTGGCGTGYTAGDLIADTVPEQQPAGRCIEEPSACGGGDKPIHNYMNYTDDECMYRFTPEQINRMRCSIANYRAQLPTEGVINQPPMASFAYEAVELEVSFSDTSSDADGTVGAWAWDFGDSTTAEEASPVHVFANEGVYEVQLRVTDDAMGSSSSRMDVVANIAPIAEFSFDADDLAVAFTDASSDAGTIEGWQWDFGDGGASTDANPVHTYAQDGIYEVTLTVTDNLNGTHATTKRVGAGADANVDSGCGCDAGHGGSTGGSAAMLLAVLGAIAMRRRSLTGSPR